MHFYLPLHSICPTHNNLHGLITQIVFGKGKDASVLF